jgi:HAD superfamily hydrolase (TIGR01509 family)
MSGENSRLAAAIFDMDGVLVDSNPFHVQKWVDLLRKHHIPFRPEDLPGQVLGHRNDTAFRLFFGPRLTEGQRSQLSEELEDTFRKAFAPHARPLPGLTELIQECHGAEIPMAVASSAMAKNVEFVVDALGYRPYFRCLVTGDEVVRPKPDPEIYLRTAHKLGVEPAGCVAFEDSFVGIEAAKRAGMKCVAIASTFPAAELRQQTQADLIVPGFEGLTLRVLHGLFGGNRGVQGNARYV